MKTSGLEYKIKIAELENEIKDLKYQIEGLLDQLGNERFESAQVAGLLAQKIYDGNIVKRIMIKHPVTGQDVQLRLHRPTSKSADALSMPKPSLNPAEDLKAEYLAENLKMTGDVDDLEQFIKTGLGEDLRKTALEWNEKSIDEAKEECDKILGMHEAAGKCNVQD